MSKGTFFIRQIVLVKTIYGAPINLLRFISFLTEPGMIFHLENPVPAPAMNFRSCSIPLLQAYPMG